MLILETLFFNTFDRKALSNRPKEHTYSYQKGIVHAFFQPDTAHQVVGQIYPVQVSNWKKEFQQQAASLFEQKRGPKPADPVEDLEELYSEIVRLKVELERLKKKSGISR